jgi:hypothetical protein
MFTATYIGFIAWFVGGLFLSEQFNWCFVIFTGMAAGARRVVSALEREESAKARSNIRIAASIPAAATAQAS